MPKNADKEQAFQPRGAAARMLTVLKALGSGGPYTAQDLMQRTGLDRSGVHRAVAALIAAGFARYQLGHRQIILTNSALASFRSARAASADIERAVETVRGVIQGKRIHVDLAVLSGSGEIAIAETSDPDAGGIDYQGFMEIDLAAVLLSAIPPEEAVRHIAAASSENEDMRTLRAGFVQRVRKAGSDKYLWDDVERALCVPLHPEDGSALAIRLRPGSGGARDSRFFVSLIAEMHQKAPELFPNLG